MVVLPAPFGPNKPVICPSAAMKLTCFNALTAPNDLSISFTEIKKFVNEITLYGQPFVKDPDMTVEKLVKSKNANVISFQRFEVGEGIEKKEENFAEEVMAQIKG